MKSQKPRTSNVIQAMAILGDEKKIYIMVNSWNISSRKVNSYRVRYAKPIIRIQYRLVYMKQNCIPLIYKRFNVFIISLIDVTHSQHCYIDRYRQSLRRTVIKRCEYGL